VYGISEWLSNRQVKIESPKPLQHGLEITKIRLSIHEKDVMVTEPL